MLISLDFKPSDRQLRQFGWIALVAFGILGLVIRWKGGLFGLDFGGAAPTVTHVLWGAGIVSALFAAVWPKANKPLFIALSLIAFPIGFVVSHAVMLVLFYFVLTPVALLFKLIGRDALHRKFEPERDSYWVDLPEIADNKQYFRQF